MGGFRGMSLGVVGSGGAVATSFWSFQIGMMELRAAGVNTFQALAAGMDPVHIAMMEGAQVMGAFVQGGMRLSMLLGPIGAAASLLGVAFLGLVTKTDYVVKAQERLNKMYEIGKGAIEKMKLTGKDLNEQLEAEISNRGRLGAALLGMLAVAAIPGKGNDAFTALRLSIRLERRAASPRLS